MDNCPSVNTLVLVESLGTDLSRTLTCSFCWKAWRDTVWTLAMCCVRSLHRLVWDIGDKETDAWDCSDDGVT